MAAGLEFQEMAPERGLKDLATAEQFLTGTTQNLNIPCVDHTYPRPWNDLQYPKGIVLCDHESLQFHLLMGFRSAESALPVTAQ